MAAIKSKPGGRKIVSTQDFVTQLTRVNWLWPLHEANKWIEHYVTSFKDISQQEGKLRTFMMYNPYGGI